MYGPGQTYFQCNSFFAILLERKVGEVAISERNETSFVYHLVSPKLWSISYTTLNRPFDCFFFSAFDMEKFRKFHRHHWKDCLKISSLLSKRFQSSYGAKVRAGAKNKKVEGGGGREKRNPPPPLSFLFFCSRPNFSRRTGAETLAMQAIKLAKLPSLKVIIC